MQSMRLAGGIHHAKRIPCRRLIYYSIASCLAFLLSGRPKAGALASWNSLEAELRAIRQKPRPVTHPTDRPIDHSLSAAYVLAQTPVRGFSRRTLRFRSRSLTP